MGMAIIKVVAKSVAALAAFYVFFAYVGGFSARQSFVLGVCVVVFAANLHEILKPLWHEWAFSPFRVRIKPNWYPLLSDFKLILNSEEWKRLSEVVEELSASEYNVLHCGFLFTVIKPPGNYNLPLGLNGGMTFWDDRKTFVRMVELSEPILRVKNESAWQKLERLEKQQPLLHHPGRPNLPRLSFKWGTDGYELGLEVDSDWWRQLCDSGEIGQLSKAENDTDYVSGITRLGVATLPYSEFVEYYETLSDDQKQKAQALRDEKLEVHGWEREEEEESGIDDPWSRLEHKYFTISHMRA